MKRTTVAVTVALIAGVGIGVGVQALAADPMRALSVPGGPLVPVGASGTGTVAWLLEPASRTIYACTDASHPTCAKTQLP